MYSMYVMRTLHIGYVHVYITCVCVWVKKKKEERYINVLLETKMAYKTKQEITS